MSTTQTLPEIPGETPIGVYIPAIVAILLGDNASKDLIHDENYKLQKEKGENHTINIIEFIDRSDPKLNPSNYFKSGCITIYWTPCVGYEQKKIFNKRFAKSIEIKYKEFQEFEKVKQELLGICDAVIEKLKTSHLEF